MLKENYKNPVNHEEVQSLDKSAVFEQIKTPQELLDFMSKNIEYGFIGKSNGRKYSWRDADMDKDFEKEYFLQSPEDLIKSGYGVCWDSTELERRWFAKNGYDFKVYFMMFAKDHANNLPTHTFLVYKIGDAWYWFEHADGQNRGIYRYESLESLMTDVKSRHIKYAISQRGARMDDEKDLVIQELNEPKFGCDPQGFINQVFTKEEVE